MNQSLPDISVTMAFTSPSPPARLCAFCADSVHHKPGCQNSSQQEDLSSKVILDYASYCPTWAMQSQILHQHRKVGPLFFLLVLFLPELPGSEHHRHFLKGTWNKHVLPTSPASSSSSHVNLFSRTTVSNCEVPQKPVEGSPSSLFFPYPHSESLLDTHSTGH